MINCLGDADLYEQKGKVMKTYRVVYRETLVHVFYVDANNEEEAKESFEQDMMDGKFDFSDGEVEDAKYEIKEDN